MKNWLLIGCVAFGLAGCYTPQDRAAGGALLGGGVGSAVGAAATGTWGGALLGGAVGAASGAIIGAATAPPPECRRYRYRGRWYEECY